MYSTSHQDLDTITIDAPMTDIDHATITTGTNAKKLAMPNANTAPPAPFVPDFSTLSARDQAHIHSLRWEITQRWGIVSPASAFPAHLHPDPDPNNWGVGLLGAILRLADATNIQDGVRLVCRSVEMENEGKFFSLFLRSRREGWSEMEWDEFANEAQACRSSRAIGSFAARMSSTRSRRSAPAG
jgi:hypothetical protein